MTQQSHYWAYTLRKDKCTPMFIAALFTIARTWKPPKHPLTDEWKKDDVVHICNGILLSPKKEQNWVIRGDVDGLRVCHTEGSKSGRDKYHISVYVGRI